MKYDRSFVKALDIDKIPQFRQTQRALSDQLADLMDLANHFGLYDAADYLRDKIGR